MQKTVYLYSVGSVKALVAQSCLTLGPRGLSSTRFLYPRNSPGKNPGVSCLSLLQGDLPDPGLLTGMFFIWATREALLQHCYAFVQHTFTKHLTYPAEVGTEAATAMRRRPQASFVCMCRGWSVRVGEEGVPHKCAWPEENWIFIKPKPGSNKWQFRRSPHLSHVK